MVSFSCEECGDILTKKKLDPHRNRCHGATFTCIDCMVHFRGVQYRSHTSCMTEDQKYQGALYKDKSNKTAKNYINPQNQSNKSENTQPAKKTKIMSRQPYVEDVPEDSNYVQWATYNNDTLPANRLPEAPTPPAIDEPRVNVFDFLVATGQTPNASNTNLPVDAKPQPGATSLIRYDELDTAKYPPNDDPLVQYGTGPAPTANYVTPAPKAERRRKDGDKKDKKRKRMHVDVPGDEEMTDAPPVLHSGLTGGLKSMMRPVFPPSPDYSGADVPEVSPTSPSKKTRHSKTSKNGHISNSIFGRITGGSKKSKKSKDKKRQHRTHRDKSPKMLEYSKKAKTNTDGQVILLKPRADVFLGYVNKGPESDRGCSINKALKRYHRERKSSGANVPKLVDEKELWRSLRLRRNDRGEIVIFAL